MILILCPSCDHLTDKAEPACTLCGHERPTQAPVPFEINDQKIRGQYPLVAKTLPTHIPGVECDKHGHAIIRNKHHEADVLARCGFARKG